MERSKITVQPPATIHLIGICGTGMGALAGLLVARGFTVTGSDANPYPPMSDELARMGIRVMEGFHEDHLGHQPDLVVIGNICRADHPEARKAMETKTMIASLPHVLHDLFLRDRTPLVVTGTHGKTTTTALLAFLLERSGLDPSVLVGGVTRDFGTGHKLGGGDFFVIEGDEYDSAFFEKQPKFLSYAPHAAIVTSIEHDHIDIYPTEADYENAFFRFMRMVSQGPLSVYSGDSGIQKMLHEIDLDIPVLSYGVRGDPCPYEPSWLAILRDPSHFELRIEGRSAGIFQTPLPGRHNLRNVLAALSLAHLSAGISLEELRTVLPDFGGVMRRQQLIGTFGGVTLYDDFAHHPTAVRLTLEALKQRHATGNLIAAFEPRSATACRNLHQEIYVSSFDAADRVVIAPVARNLAPEDTLDTRRLADDLNRRGNAASAEPDIPRVLQTILDIARPGDSVVLLSNGSFGGLVSQLPQALVPSASA